jgi:hypothetical protein
VKNTKMRVYKVARLKTRPKTRLLVSTIDYKLCHKDKYVSEGGYEVDRGTVCESNG